MDQATNQAVEAAEEKQELPQAVLDEALQPELSEDFFIFEGQKVAIMPLKLKYRNKYKKILHPLVDAVAFDLSTTNKAFHELRFGDWLQVFAKSLEHPEVLGQAIQILCHNAGVMITDEQLGDATISDEEMQTILLRYSAKAGDLERQVSDFFTVVMPAVKSEIGKYLANAKEQAQMMLNAEEPSTTTV